MNKLSLDNLIYSLILGYSFVFGGALQFFLGVSNTGSVFMFTLILLFIYIHYAYVKGKLIINGFVLISILTISYIILNSVINQTKLIPSLLYVSSVLMPISIYLNEKKKESSWYNQIKLKRFLLIIALVQIPILIIQKIFYNSLIAFNHSRQQVALIDFSFGSFLLKDDHALGFFLISNFLFVSFDTKLKLSRTAKIIFLMILTISISMLNSKLTILLFFFTLVYIFYKKSGFVRISRFFVIGKRLWFTVGFFLITSILFVSQPSYIKYIKQQLNQNIDYDLSLRRYLTGNAKRGQTINVWLHQKIKWLGNGPYSFYNIAESSFSEYSVNFSQWLWIYNDLGIIGLTLFLVLFLSMANAYANNSPPVFFNFLFFVYAFFAIVMFDISFMMIYFIYNRSSE